MKERRFPDAPLQEFTHEGFVVRRRLPLFILALLFILVYLAAMFLVYRAGAADALFTLGALLALMLGGLCLFVIAFTQRNRDLVMATEFQNMLFAAAASVKSEFVLITQRDGTVVYFNPGFQNLFGSRHHASTILDTVLEGGKLDEDQKAKVHDAIASGHYAATGYDYSQGKDHRTMVLHVDPLARPHGYSLIRGVNPENNSDESAHTDGGMSRFLLDNLLHTVPFGLYTLSAQREVTFCNDTFAEMVGMESKDIVARHMDIGRLVRESELAELFGRMEYRGEKTFIKHDGSPVRLFVRQEALTGSDNEIVGYKAIVEDTHVSPSQPKGNDADAP